jgi:hypothetical protein
MTSDTAARASCDPRVSTVSFTTATGAPPEVCAGGVSAGGVGADGVPLQPPTASIRKRKYRDLRVTELLYGPLRRLIC